MEGNSVWYCQQFPMELTLNLVQKLCFYGSAVWRKIDYTWTLSRSGCHKCHSFWSCSDPKYWNSSQLGLELPFLYGIKFFSTLVVSHLVHQTERADKIIIAFWSQLGYFLVNKTKPVVTQYQINCSGVCVGVLFSCCTKLLKQL